MSKKQIHSEQCKSTCPAERQRDSDPLENETRITLNHEIWQRVLASSLMQQARILFNQIFKRGIAVFAFEAMGMTREEFEHMRGPIPFLVSLSLFAIL